MSVSEETRLESYLTMDKKARRKEVLEILESGPATAREIAYALGFKERNASAPRLVELRKAGKVEVTGKKKCSVTGKTVSVYSKVKEDNHGKKS